MLDIFGKIVYGVWMNISLYIDSLGFNNQEIQVTDTNDAVISNVYIRPDLSMCVITRVYARVYMCMRDEYRRACRGPVPARASHARVQSKNLHKGAPDLIGSLLMRPRLIV